MLSSETVIFGSNPTTDTSRSTRKNLIGLSKGHLSNVKSPMQSLPTTETTSNQNRTGMPILDNLQTQINKSGTVFAQTFANLEIEVFADDNEYWDGSYCCPAGTMDIHNMGSLNQPLNGTHVFYTTCEGNFSIGTRLDYPSTGVILVVAYKNGDIHHPIATAPKAITQQYNWINVDGYC